MSTSSENSKLYRCDLCPHLPGWKKAWRLNEHRKNAHPQSLETMSNANEFECDFCNKHFKDKRSKIRHIGKCEKARKLLWKPQSASEIPPFLPTTSDSTIGTNSYSGIVYKYK
jgi:hypothetical protein